MVNDLRMLNVSNKRNSRNREVTLGTPYGWKCNGSDKESCSDNKPINFEIECIRPLRNS